MTEDAVAGGFKGKLVNTSGANLALWGSPSEGFHKDVTVVMLETCRANRFVTEQTFSG